MPERHIFIIPLQKRLHKWILQKMDSFVITGVQIICAALVGCRAYIFLGVPNRW